MRKTILINNSTMSVEDGCRSYSYHRKCKKIRGHSFQYFLPGLLVLLLNEKLLGANY